MIIWGSFSDDYAFAFVFLPFLIGGTSSSFLSVSLFYSSKPTNLKLSAAKAAKINPSMPIYCIKTVPSNNNHRPQKLIVF